jgi:cystine transport system permease protein
MIYYGLPQFGIELDPIPAAMIGLSLNTAAYAAENSPTHRLPGGHTDTGRRFPLPFVNRGDGRAQGFRLPPLSNSFISLVKDTSLAATIQVPELFRQAQLITTVRERRQSDPRRLG